MTTPNLAHIADAKARVNADIAARQPLRALELNAILTHRFKEREPLLSPILHTQDLAMVFAGRGIGKTHLALAISCAIATGGRLLSWSAPKARKVLYLDGELPGAVMQDRLRLHRTDPAPMPGFLRVFTPDLLPDDRAMPDLATLAGQEAVESMIEDDTTVIVIDNLSAWVRSGRENEAESWHPMSDWLLSLRRRGIAVLVVHHAGKGGAQRGTSKKEDLLDLVMGLDRPKDYETKHGARFVLSFTKARHLTGSCAESLEISLQVHDSRAHWSHRTVELSTFDRVVRLASDGLTPSEISTELEVNKSTVSRHLRAAREQGLVRGTS